MAAIVAGAVFFAGCGKEDRQEQALKRLDDAALSFTVANFHRCAKEGHLVELLNYLDAGMHPDAPDREGRTPILLASAGGFDKIVRLLLDRGADPNQAGDDGRTLLMQAVQRRDVRTAEHILDAGARPDAVDKEGWGVQKLAAKRGVPEILHRLMPETSEQLNQCIFLAAAEGHTRCLDLLLESGAWIDIRREHDETPLMVAASHGRKEAVALMLDRGADRLALDSRQETARDRAFRLKHGEVVALLSHHHQLPDPGAAADLFMGKDIEGMEWPPLNGQSIRADHAPDDGKTFLLGDHLRFTGLANEKLPFYFSGRSRKGHPVVHQTNAYRQRYGTPIKVGDRLPRSSLTLSSIRTETWNDRSVDCLVLTDTKSDRHFLLPEKTEIPSGQTVGTLRSPFSGQGFRVQSGDEFSIQPIGRDYLVLEISPRGMDVFCHSTNTKLFLSRTE